MKFKILVLTNLILASFSTFSFAQSHPANPAPHPVPPVERNDRDLNKQETLHNINGHLDTLPSSPASRSQTPQTLPYPRGTILTPNPEASGAGPFNSTGTSH